MVITTTTTDSAARQPSTSAVATSVAPTSTKPANGLSAKLLTVEDLGSQWVLGEPANEMDLAMSPKVCEGVELDAELAARLSGEVGVQFVPADDSPKHLMNQIITGEPAQLRD